jgi:hypothetical protein
VELKHQSPEQTMGQNINPKGNEKLSWNSAKLELRGKFISLKTYIQKRKLFLTNNLTRSRKRTRNKTQSLIVSKFGFVNGSCVSLVHKFAQGFLFPSVMEHQEPFYIELLKFWTKNT